MDTGGPISRRGGVVLRTLAESPLCSIVIPCHHVEEHVERAVRAAAAQDYPADRLEILVVDGGSCDRTRDVVRALAASDPRVALLDSPTCCLPTAMNVAIKRSRGDVILRMDVRAEYEPGYVAAAVAALRRTGALHVGGAMRLRGESTLERALCAALTSPLAPGVASLRDPEREGFVERVWCGAFRRETFELAGLFDPEAATHADGELCQRILARGGQIFQDRSIIGHCYPAASLASLIRSELRDGMGAARLLHLRGRLPSWRPLLPFAGLVFATLFAALAAAWPPAQPAGKAALLLALFVLFVEALRVSWRPSLRLAPLVVWILPLMHLAHGVGFGFGLVWFAERAPRDVEPERLAAR